MNLILKKENVNMSWPIRITCTCCYPCCPHSTTDDTETTRDYTGYYQPQGGNTPDSAQDSVRVEGAPETQLGGEQALDSSDKNK